MQRIVVRTEVQNGAPCVAGTEVKVAEVLRLLERGCSVQEVRNKHFPNLTLTDIRACAQYGSQWCGSEWLVKAGRPHRRPSYHASFWFHYGLPLLIVALLAVIGVIQLRTTFPPHAAAGAGSGMDRAARP